MAGNDHLLPSQCRLYQLRQLTFGLHYVDLHRKISNYST
jgi:hypothetical protein